MIIPNTKLYSDTEWGSQATIDTVLFSPFKSAGDTLDVITVSTANVTGMAKLRLTIDNHLKIVSPSSTFYTDESIYLDSGTVRYDTIRVVAQSSGTATLDFSIATDSAKSTFYVLPAILTTAYEIKNSPDLNIPWWNLDMIPDYSEYFSDLGYIGGDINFKVTGKVDFDYIQEISRTNESKFFPGYVRLWFVRPEMYYQYHRFHPITPISGYIEGTHYSKIDENGEYEFDFDISTNVATGIGWKVFVQVCKFNDIFDLYTDTGEQHVLSSYQDDPFRMMQWNQAFSSEYISNSANQEYRLNLRAAPNDGNILRNGSLIQKFILNRFQVATIGALPINDLPADERLPQIRCDLIKRTSSKTGQYVSNKIYITDPGIGITSHEYGHYLNDAFGNYQYFSGDAFNFTEGFACFFGFAAESWIQNTYGDELGWFGNLEAAPYTGKNYGDYPRFKWDRFEGCGKANNDYQCEFACYLWDLYDSYYDNEYNFYSFDGENNDDVNINGKFLFEFIANKFHKNYTMDSLNYHIKQEYTSDIELVNSIQAIWNSMFDADSTKRSAQCNWNHTAELYMGNWKYRIDITPRTYDESTYYDWINYVFPKLIEYPYTLDHIGNEETGWKVYKQNGSSWDLIETSSTTPIRIDKVTGTYYVTSYNDNAYRKNLLDNAGNSINPTQTILNYKSIFNDKNESEQFLEPKQFQTSVEFGVLIDDKLQIEKIDLLDFEGKNLNNLVHSQNNRIYFNTNYLTNMTYFLTLTYYYNGKKFFSTYKFLK